MELDIKVRRCFVKRSMSRHGDDPVRNQPVFSTYRREEIGPKHTFPARKSPLQRVPSRGAS
jgi:hypothetical protein